MCGICGIMIAGGDKLLPAGSILQDMMECQQIRAQDGAGVAVFNKTNNDDSYRIKSFRKENSDRYKNVQVITSINNAGEALATITDDPNLSFTSFENEMTLVKDVGLAKDLDKKYRVREMTGTHGIGHLRIATSSRVTPFNTHPFSTSILPDIAIVHNGEITNYKKLRHSLELEGYNFYTDSDSEVIAVFLASRIIKHGDVEKAHNEFLKKADGPFTYIAATADSLAIVRDKFGTRKGIVGYNLGTDGNPPFWAMATDLSALDIVGATTKIETPPPGKPRIFYRN